MPDEDAPDEGHSALGTGWGIDGSLTGFGDDIFAKEIAGISESDWDLDTNELWGDAVPTDPDDDASGGELFG